MDSPKIESISVADLTSKIKDAVASLKEGDSLFQPGAEISFVTNPNIIGFILQDAAVRERSVADVMQFAAGLSDKVGPLGGGNAASVLVRGGDILVGFFPANIALRL